MVLPTHSGLKISPPQGGFVDHYEETMKLFVHNKGSNNGIMTGFDVL